LEKSATRLRFAQALTDTTFDASMPAGDRDVVRMGAHNDAKSVMPNASISPTAAPPRGLMPNRGHDRTVAEVSDDAADVGGGDEHWQPQS
jgi:hypothetical protein